MLQWKSPKLALPRLKHILYFRSFAACSPYVVQTVQYVAITKEVSRLRRGSFFLSQTKTVIASFDLCASINITIYFLFEKRRHELLCSKTGLCGKYHNALPSSLLNSSCRTTLFRSDCKHNCGTEAAPLTHPHSNGAYDLFP